MTSAVVELPDNLPACHAIIRRQAEVIDELRVLAAEQAAQIAEQAARIDRFNRDLATVKRQLFGAWFSCQSSSPAGKPAGVGRQPRQT